MKIVMESLVIAVWIGLGALCLWAINGVVPLGTEGFGIAGASHATLDGPAVYHIWQDGDAFLVDARTPEQFRLMHIPGAINIPLGALKERLSVLPIDKDTYLITYCGNLTCPKAYQLRALLVAHGYRNVHFYPGGLHDWFTAGYPLAGTAGERDAPESP